MTKDEALKWALEALENSRIFVTSREKIKHPEGTDWYDERISAIKEALAQEQEPLAWKLVPIKPTDEMLKAMDECSMEGYDERLYARHAASVYMAAVDVAPTPSAQRKPLTDEHPLVVFAKECVLGAYKESELGDAARRAIEAAYNIKGEA